MAAGAGRGPGPGRGPGGPGPGGRLPARPLRQARGGHPHARRRAPVHGHLHAPGRRTVPHPAAPHRLRHRSVRAGRLPRRAGAQRRVGAGRVHLRLPGRAGKNDERGRLPGDDPAPGRAGGGRGHGRLGHHRLAAAAGAREQRTGGRLGHLLPGLLCRLRPGGRPPGPQGRLAPGADGRPVRRGRRPSQRRPVPGPDLLVRRLLRLPPPGAHRPATPAALPPGPAGQLPVLPGPGGPGQRGPPLFPRPGAGVGRGHGPRHLRRLLESPGPAPPPAGHPPGGAHRGRLVRRRGPVRHPAGAPAAGGGRPRAQFPGHGPLGPRRLVLGPGGPPGRSGIRLRHGRGLPAAPGGPVLPPLPQGRSGPGPGAGSTPGLRPARGPRPCTCFRGAAWASGSPWAAPGPTPS